MLEQPQRIHLIGIGGIGVSGVARWLNALGHAVSGSDVKESSITRALRAEGVEVHIGHAAEHVHGRDLVVRSTAIPADNPELQEAERVGVRVVHRAEVLGELLAGREAVGVVGTHGKGTVCTMITRILDAAGRDPGFIIGGLLLDYGTNARLGDGDLVVAEVDESDGSHLHVHPSHVVVNNLELDHLNYYSGLDEIIDKAVRFIEGNPRLEHLVLNVGCPGVAELARRITRPYLSCSVVGPADLRAVEVVASANKMDFSVLQGGETLGRFTLPLPGEYNVENALAAVTLARALGIDRRAVATGLAGCSGLENRFTVVSAGGVRLVKDYLSHPNGMRKVLRAARRLDRGRMWVVYQPYRYTLLKYLGGEYAEAFGAADKVILTDLYAAGEAPIEGVPDDYLVRRCQTAGLDVTHVPGIADARRLLAKQARPGDVVALFGGDDFFRMADALAGDLEARAEPTGDSSDGC